MCGIIGYFSLTPSLRDAKNFNRGMNVLSHRGPDDKGCISFRINSGEGFLGHTRLSIIDLSKSGHQPMQSFCGRFTIIFNGEIYNYRELRNELAAKGFSFKSNSDTEVLLVAWIVWREECMTRLVGMFSFTVLDELENTLYCVRDPFGIKPLYYYKDDSDFYFGSEIQALVELSGHTLKPNFQMGFNYLAGGTYDSSVETFFEGVNQLLPGHILMINLQKFENTQISRWWWPSIEETCKLTFSEAANHLRVMFLESIRLHLRSDVPIGAALSGGLDSSAIVCAMRYLEPELTIHTFSFLAPNSAVNEERWVDIINRKVNALAHKVNVNPQDWVADLDDMIQTQGEPFGSTSIYAQYRVYKLAKEVGVTVTLDGQGADELLAGYTGYPTERIRSLLTQFHVIEAINFFLAWSKWPGRSSSNVLKQLLSPIVPNYFRRKIHWLLGSSPSPSWIDINFVRKMRLRTDLYALGHLLGDPIKGRNLMNELRRSLTGGGLNMLLRHGDRNSMRWSIESRVPFLTSDIANFLLSLPENYLISDQGETKHIFREAMKGIVPSDILNRKDKIGFESPERDWLIASKPLVEEIIKDAVNIPILNGMNCQKIVAKFFEGEDEISSRILWRIINYCRWYKLTFNNVE